VYCASALAAGARCAIRVVFHPSHPAAFSGEASVTYSGGFTAGRSIKGMGTVFAQLAIREDSDKGGPAILFDFGLHPAGQSSEQVFLVANLGGAEATNLAAADLADGFAFPGGTFPGGTGTYTASSGAVVPLCGTGAAANLPAGEQCAVRVAFEPALAQAYTTALHITFANGSGDSASANRDLRGTGTDLAVVELGCNNCNHDGVPVLDFGMSAAGSSHAAFVQVRNNGAQATILSDGATLSGGFAYAGGTFPGGSGQVNTGNGPTPFCGPAPYSLAPGSTCLIQLTFTAPDSSGAVGGIFTLATGGSLHASETLALTGASTKLAVVTVNDCIGCNGGGGGGGQPNHDFGYVALGAESTATFIVSNQGASAAALTDGGLAGSGFTWTGGTYPGGTGTTFLGGMAYPFCADTLAAGSGCVVRVSYQPSGTMQQTGSFSLGLGGATTPSVGYALSGTPTSLAVLSLSACLDCGGGGGGGTPTWDFGLVATDSDVTQTFFVRNSGNSAATLTSVTVGGDGFAWTGGTFPGGNPGTLLAGMGPNPVHYCPAQGGALEPGQTCAIQVTMSAHGISQQKGSLSLSFASAIPSSVAYNLQGMPTNLAIVSLTDCVGCGGGNGGGTPKHDFGYVALGSQVTATFFVANHSAKTATISGGSLGGAGFGWADGVGFPGGAGALQVDGGSYPFCGDSLEGNAVCVVQVMYSPSGTQTQQGSLGIQFAGATAASAGFDLSGTPTSLAVLSISLCENCGGTSGNATPTWDFGTVAADSQVNRLFYLRNSGASPATLSGASIFGDGFAWTGGTFPGGNPGTAAPIWGAPPVDFCPAGGGQLGAGQRCVFQVTFSAHGQAQQKGGFGLSFSGAVAPGLSYNLQGQATTLGIVFVRDCANCGSGGPGGDMPTHDFGTTAAGKSYVQHFVFTNAGANTVTLVPDPLSGDPAFSWNSSDYLGTGFPGLNPGSISTFGGVFPVCGGSLAGGSTCVAAVTYAASGSTVQSGEFSVALSGATTSAVAYHLTGAPTTAAIFTATTCLNCGLPTGVTPTQDFGPVEAPGTYTKWFFLQNAGSSPGSVTAATMDGDAFAWGSNGFDGSGYPGAEGGLVNVYGTNYSVCPALGEPIAGGQSCVFSVKYQASGADLQSGGFTLSVSGATLPSLHYQLAGHPTALAIVSITECPFCGMNPNGFDFGTAGTALDHLLLVNNTGASPAGLSDDTGWNESSLFGFTGGVYPGGVDTASMYGQVWPFCGASLAGHSSCFVSVRYLGTVTGTGTLTLGLGGATAPSASEPLKGTATARALLTVGDQSDWFPCTDTSCGGSPASFATPVDTSSPSRTFVVANRGALQASLGEVGLGEPFFFGTGTPLAFPGGSGSAIASDGVTWPLCGATLAAGTRCAVVVYLHPTAVGPAAGSLSIPYSDTIGSVTPAAVRTLSGTGQPGS